MTIKTKRNATLLNSSSLFVLGTASVLLGSGPAQAFDANALPTGGNVTGGAASIATSGNTLTVNQSSNRAIIDWRSFNIGANAQANFVQPGTNSIAVNRVNGSTDPSRIDGGLHANGQVWVLNPNGVFFGKTARVDAAGVVATTANINDKAFMAGSNKLQMTGGDSGQVVNEGHISVGEGGLAAFVAPSVRNSGTIRARLGKVTLAAGDTYTLDLAGDRLVEIGLGSSKAVVDQSGKIVNAGGVIEISAKAAGQVVDAVINTSGVTDASSVRTVGGKIVLGADVINVASTAAIKADGTSGGQITAVAGKTGNYAGSYSAQGTTGDGGQIETSAPAVNIDNKIAVNTQSAHGKTGTWTLDPTDFTVTNGGPDTGTNTFSNTYLSSLLDGSNINLQASNSITVNGVVDASGNAHAGNLSLTDEGSGHLTIALNAAIKLKAGSTLSGRGAIVNVGATALAQNGIDVAATGGTVNLAAVTYNEALNISTNGLHLNGNGATIAPVTLLDTHTGHKYDADVKTAVFVNGASGVTLDNLTIDGGTLGANAVVFWNNSSGTISNSHIKNETVLNGGQTGQGLAVDASDGSASTLLVDTVDFRGFNKNAIDAVNGDGATSGGGNIDLTVKNSTITGAGNTGTNAQNGILVWERAGGTVNLTADGDHFSNLSYNDPNTATAAGVIVYGVHNGAVSVSNSDFTNVQEYVSTADSTHEVNATVGNIFDGVDETTATLDQLFAIENHMNHGTEDASTSLVRVKAGQVYVTAAKGDIADSLLAASIGDTINIQDGTYVVPSGGSNYLDITKAVTLKGQSEGGTIIDASNASAYGLRVQADNVSLSDFTLKGPTASGGYGIKVEPLENVITPADRVHNFSIANVTETGSYKNGLDLNGVLGGTVTNVTVSGTTHGTGIAITDSAGVTLTGNSTTGNAWGGLALYQHNATYDQQVNNISVDATNTFGEANGVYMEDESASKDFGSVSIAGYDHAVKATVAPNDTYTWLQNGEQTAINFAVANAANTASVQGWTGTGVDNTFVVTTGLKIQSAVDAATNGATINVDAGTYNEDVSIGKQVNLLSVSGAGATTINGVAGTGALGTIYLKAGSDGSNIGSVGHGFTIVGFDGPTAVENAAIYIQGANAGTTVAGNHITANGDEAILSEYNAAVTGLTIDHNVIDGTTFNGANPASGDQFSVPNVARGLVYISGGAGVTNTQNIIFTNNDVKGITGGANGNSNYLVTIDSVGSTITGNTFEGTVTGTSAQLRTRGSNATISGNSFDSANLGNNAQAVEIASSALSGGTTTSLQDVLDTNSFDRSVWLDHTLGGSYYIGVSINNAVNAASAGDTVNVGTGTYNESVLLNKADLTLKADGAAIIDAGGADTAVTVSTAAGLGTITIDGFTIQGWTSRGINQDYNGWSAGTAALNVTNNTVYGPAGGATAHGNGIEVSGNGSVVSGNTVINDHLNSTDWSGSGIIAVNGSGITIENNTVNGADTGIAVVNWNNTDGMSNITVHGNTVSNATDEGIGVQAFEGEYFGEASGSISGLAITGNTVSDSLSGLGIWDYSADHRGDWASTVSDISGNSFADNSTHISSDFTGAAATSLLARNNFDRTVVNAAGTPAIYGDVNTAISNEAAGSTLNLSADHFGSGILVNQDGDSLVGTAGTVIDVLHNGDNGITIAANNVTIRGLEIAGPASDINYAWGSDITRGIVVKRDATGFDITGNNIHGTRNNILVDGLGNTGSITGNTIAASKSGISVQYTDGGGIDISHNTDGGNANEWGMNLHLNGHYDDDTGTIVGTKIDVNADAVTQGQILYDSLANNNWTVQDQGYINSNRSAVTVATTGSDANQGSALNSLATIQAGINAVVNGGTVNVKAGSYDQALDIEKALNIAGAGAGQTIIKPTALLDTHTGHKYDSDVQTAVFVNGVGQVNIDGVTIDGNGLGANAVVFWNNAGGSITNSEITNPSAFNGAQTGQGIAIDATDGYQSDLLIDNVSFHDWNKNAIDAVTGDGATSNGGTIGLTVKNSTFTGQGATGVTAQNGILLWERGGGSVNATIDNSTFKDLSYNDPTTATAAGVLLYGVQSGAVKISNSTFTNVQEYVSTAASASEVDATTGNTFDGVSADTATLDQLFAIEDHMNHGTEDATTSLVRVRAGQVYVSADKGDIADSVAAASAGDTVNIQNGAYTLPGELDINKSLTLKGQSEAGTVIGSSSTGYGIYVDANDVTLSDFTFNPSAAGTYGIKVEPATTVASDRVTGFGIDHLTIAGSQKTGLDLNGVNGATIDNVTVTGTVNGNGIALTDSANVAITNTSTDNNAWGGLALYQTNNTYDQQVNNVTVDGNSSFAEVNGIYAQDQSAANDFGSIDLSGQGLQYVAKLSTGGTDGDYTFFQKTQQGALDIVSAFNGRYGINGGTVQGYGGTGVNGDNHFTVGTDSNGTALSVNAALDQSSTGGIIDVLNGTYAENVAIIAPRTVNFDDATLNSLSVFAGGSGSTLSGSVKAGSVTVVGDIALGGDLSLDTSAAGGTIALANVDGAHALTLNAGSTGVVLVGGLGATTRLGAVDITADLIGLGATNKAASFDFNGDVALSAASTVIDTTVSSTAAGNITFAGDIFGTTDGGQSLTLLAGPGTGDKSANGDIAMNNAGLSNLRLGGMTVNGDDFTALTVDLAGGFTSQLSGNQLFAADTLNAGGDVNSNAAGNIGGHIVSGGNVNLTAGGNISGDITGKTVTLNGKTVNDQVTANTLNVNAQSGTITGTFTPGSMSNGLLVNGKVVGAPDNTGGTGGTGGTGNTANNFPNVNAQQLVVEGFALPAGTQIGANGQLILPPGTVIGLLSPGGGTPRVIMVQSVQELGALLDQGYSAIVIDLTGHKKATTKIASN